MKKGLIIAGSVVVLLILIVLALPLFVSANTFKPMLERDLTEALGRKVAIGNISLSILSGSVAVDSFQVADDPAFSSAPFLTAQKLSAGVSLVPLIFSKKLDITSLTITDPRITLLRAASGRWNYSSLGASSNAGAAPSSGASAANNFSVGKLHLVDGTITVGEAGNRRTRQYSNVDLEAGNVSYASSFPFQLTAATPGGGSVRLDGKAGPIQSADASLTPFDLTLNVKNFDLAATGMIDPSAGIGGVVNFDGTLTSNGRQATSKGTVQAEKLRLAPNATPAGVPVGINYATSYDLRSGVGTLTQGDLRVGKARAQLTGGYNLAGAVAALDMKLHGTAMPATDLQGVFPALGVTLPAGAALQSGALDTDLSVSGPLDKLVIAGPVKLTNARLSGFDLGGKLGALAAFAGLNSKNNAETVIQMLSAALRVDAAGTALHNLVMAVPALGTLSGDAAISPAGQLNCNMVAHLAANVLTNALGNAVSKLGQSKLGGLLGALTGGQAAAGSHTGAAAGAGVTIPFRITGTTARPVFLPGR
jgi:AsmA protein